MNDIDSQIHEYKPVIVDGVYNPDLEFISEIEKRWKGTPHGLDTPSFESYRFGQSIGEYISEMERPLGNDGVKLFYGRKEQLDLNKKFVDLTVREFMILTLDNEGFEDEQKYAEEHFHLEDKIFQEGSTLRDTLLEMKEGTPFGILFYSTLYRYGGVWRFSNR